MDHYKTGLQIHVGDPIFDGEFSLIGRDFQTGESVWCKELPDGGFTIRTDTPIEKTFEANAEFEKETHGKRFGDWNRIASMPPALSASLGLDKAISQQDNKYLAKVLNDSDNRKFRTSRGNI